MQTVKAQPFYHPSIDQAAFKPLFPSPGQPVREPVIFFQIFRVAGPADSV
jgi:hypothetical protein